MKLVGLHRNIKINKIHQPRPTDLTQHLGCLRLVITARKHLITVETDPYRHLVAGALPGSLDALENEAEPVLAPRTVIIAALVEVRRCELFEQRSVADA